MGGGVTDFQIGLVAMGLASARLFALFTVMPVLNDQLVPGMARRTVVVALSLIVLPTVLPMMPSPEHLTIPDTTLLLIKETLIGVMLGFLGGIPFWIAENVGNFIDNQRGATMGEVYAPLTGSQDSPIGLLLVQMANALFFSTGAVLVYLGAVYESFHVWPVFSAMPQLSPEFPTALLGHADAMLRTTVLLSAPAVIIMFLATLGLGLINRTAPQLNVFFLSMPIKSALGIFFLMLYLEYLSSALDDQMRFDILGFMRGVFL